MPRKPSINGMVLVLAFVASACGPGGNNCTCGVPDGSTGGGVDFAGSYAGVLRQSDESCQYMLGSLGYDSNAVMTLSMPNSTEVDIVSITWCPVHGSPSYNKVNIQPVVCPTITDASGTSVIEFTGGDLTLDDATTLQVHLYRKAQYYPVAGTPLTDCTSGLSGTLKKQ